jgi:hypothetical protein
MPGWKKRTAQWREETGWKKSEYSPSQQAEAEVHHIEHNYNKRMMTSPHIHNRTPSKAHVCPRKVYRTHPDPEVRYLAERQAVESHRVWGACMRYDRRVPMAVITPIWERKSWSR